ncbi:expressed unknown protein [Seminavis robusta]|uniref:Uncharacterized protein n=1 Tax=Seminavis robusta TaxID=568900 RepID=A0A9N8DE01_9STRA|nr:expressed unknown protein [Seminavis robusta]|eukprot:Sro45_g026920.1 n/a (75) ;mRNA; f:72358-72582
MNPSSSTPNKSGAKATNVRESLMARRAMEGDNMGMAEGDVVMRASTPAEARQLRLAKLSQILAFVLDLTEDEDF